MVAIVILTLNFTLSCSEEAVPAWVDDMGPGAKQLWNRASALGLDPDIVHEMMTGINSGNRRTEEVQGLIESCKEDGVDVVAFLQQMVQDPVLPKGGPHWDEGISEMDVLRWLARASNPSVDEWLLTFAKTRLTGCVVRSGDDVSYLNGLLTVLGKMRRDEALDLQVLLEGFEEEFNLPPLAIDFGKGGGPEFEMVGEQHDFTLVVGIPYHDAAQGMRAFGFGIDSGEADDFVGQDVAVVRYGPAFDDLVHRVVLHAGDEEDALDNPGGELQVVVVRAVHDDDGTRRQAQQVQNLRVVAFGFRNQDEGRHVVIVVQQDMRFDAALGAPEPRPGEQAQAQGYGGRIQRQEFVLEPELVLARTQLPVRAEALHESPEQVLEQGSGPMLVGVRQGGLVRRVPDAQMDELPKATGEAIADLAQRIGVGQLAKQHADELRPTREPACVTFPLMPLDDTGEFGAGNLFQKLTKQTCGLYHRSTLLAGVGNRDFPYPILQRPWRVVNSPFSES